MKVFKIIIGVLMIISAVSILSVPAVGTIALSWIIPSFMLISGIFIVAHYIESKSIEKEAKKNNIPYLKTNIGCLIFGIVAIVLSILARNTIIGNVIFIKIITVIYGLWFVLNGISLIVCGSALKKLAQYGWLPFIILGILLIISGILCAVNGFVGITTVGIMLGISMMMNGFAFIFNE